jgi:hypothetical protein
MTEMTQQDMDDLAKLNAPADIEPPTYHPILQIWREVLQHADAEMAKKVTPQWATRMLSKYPGLSYADMNDVRDNYFGLIIDLRKVLDAVISTDDDCLTYSTPEDDVVENGRLYFQVLLDWQKTFLLTELEWDCTAPDAAARVAALSEVHGMFFGETGLTQYLDNIRFEFTESDQAILAEELNELRAGQEG